MYRFLCLWKPYHFLCYSFGFFLFFFRLLISLIKLVFTWWAACLSSRVPEMTSKQTLHYSLVGNHEKIFLLLHGQKEVFLNFGVFIVICTPTSCVCRFQVLFLGTSLKKGEMKYLKITCALVSIYCCRNIRHAIDWLEVNEWPTDRPTDRMNEWWSDGGTEGRTDGRTDGRIDGLLYVKSINYKTTMHLKLRGLGLQLLGS